VFSTCSFKKCGISNSLDGTEDNLLFEHSDDAVPDSEELSSVSSSEDEDFVNLRMKINIFNVT
jgi:hypothetical protein